MTETDPLVTFIQEHGWGEDSSNFPETLATAIRTEFHVQTHEDRAFEMNAIYNWQHDLEQTVRDKIALENGQWEVPERTVE